MLSFVIGFAIGVSLLQQVAQLPQIELLVILTLPLLALVWLTRLMLSQNLFVRRLVLFIFAMALGYDWAALRATQRMQDNLMPQWEQKNIELIGVVASLPEKTEAGMRFQFDVERVLTPNARVPKHILLSWYANSQHKSSPSMGTFRGGERWQLTVRLKRPHGTYNPDGMDYELFALSQNIRATGTIRQKPTNVRKDTFVWAPDYMILVAREFLAHRIDSVLSSERYAGVIRGLVIGDDSQIARLDWDMFLRTGINHLMSISGLHITMLSAMMYFLVNALWRRSTSAMLYFPAQKAATIAGVLTAMIYAALAGFSVPTQRTLYMLSVVAFALLSGRRLSFMTVLAWALMVVLLLDPWAVCFAGFWLSFGAVAIMVYATSGRLGLSSGWRSALQAQWAVTIGLVPILLCLFGQVSLISPIANAIAIPIISFIVVPLAILGSFIPIDALLWLSCQVLHGCLTLLNFLSDWPFAVWQQPPPSWVAAIAGMLGVVVLLLPKGVPLKEMGLICFLPMLFPASQTPMKGQMQMTVLDVGQGLAVLVRTAHHSLLFDTGARFSEEHDAGDRVILPYLLTQNIKALDMVVVSHDDADHSGGLSSVLSHLPVKMLLSSLPSKSNAVPSSMWPKLALLKHEPCHAGLHWTWDGVEFSMLHPQRDNDQEGIKDNDLSCVLSIRHTSGRVLIAGDIEAISEATLLTKAKHSLASEVLIVPHHGSKTSSTEAFVSAVMPQYAVITNGYLNRYGHPKYEIVQRYVKHHAEIIRSDYDGAVLFDFVHHAPIKVIKWRETSRRYWHDTYPNRF